MPRPREESPVWTTITPGVVGAKSVGSLMCAQNVGATTKPCIAGKEKGKEAKITAEMPVETTTTKVPVETSLGEEDIRTPAKAKGERTKMERAKIQLMLQDG